MSINAEVTTTSRNPHSARPPRVMLGRRGTQTQFNQVQLSPQTYDSGSNNAQHMVD